MKVSYKKPRTTERVTEHTTKVVIETRTINHISMECIVFTNDTGEHVIPAHWNVIINHK